MTSFPSVSVCIPAYNEEATIEKVLQEVHLLLLHSDLDYEILICNDGSTDRTKSIIEDSAQNYANLRVFHNPVNLGIHVTLQRLYSEATKDFVFINAADRQWKMSILLEMLPLAKEYDIIIAKRKKKPYGLFRMFISWVFNAVPYILFGVRTFDAGSSKLIRREIIGRFTLVARSPFSEAERLIRAAKAGYRITEYPVDVFPRRTGRTHAVSLTTLLEACVDVFRVWFSLKKEKIKG